MNKKDRRAIASRTTDQRPGARPDITLDGSSIVYGMAVAGARDGTDLVIRCDDAGEVWMSIRRAE
jgi:hypothetical protein